MQLSVSNLLSSALLVGLHLCPVSAHAGAPTTITVTTTADVMDATDGLCSLREAIRNVREGGAHGAVPGECAAGSLTETNRVLLQNGANYELTRAGNGVNDGELSLFRDAVASSPSLVLETPGQVGANIIQTVAGERVLLNVSAWTQLNGIGLFGGDVNGSGGAVLNILGTLEMFGGNVSDNQANSGGGIFNSAGSVLLNDTLLTLNQATDPDTGGGALYNDVGGEAVLQNARIENNQAASGGGVYNRGALIIEQESELRQNTASSASLGGGALFNGLDGSATLVHSLFEQNLATQGSGGAVRSISTEAPPLVIQHSEFLGNQAETRGGALHATGASLNGNGAIRHSRFIGNRAGESGGAISTSAMINTIVDDCYFEDNRALSLYGGAILTTNRLNGARNEFYLNQAATHGGAIYSPFVGTTHSRFDSNTAGGNGGAVYGRFAASDISMVGNHADGNGGGFYMNSTTTGSPPCSRCLIAGNSAGVAGGGLWLRGNAVLSNTTITGNTAGVDGGGGIFQASGFSLTLINVTLAGNPAGLQIVKEGDVNVQNSIIASENGDACLSSLNNLLFQSLGNNIISDDSCLGFSAPLDQINTDPLLAPLADTGGVFQSMALLPGSPAIDAADAQACATGPVSGLDQRRAQRPPLAANACDIGAHEQEAIAGRIFADGFEGE